LQLAKRIGRKAFKPLYVLYYRFAFGRDWPFDEVMAKWVGRWEQASGMGDVPQSKHSWESQYRDGDWGFLREPDEMARYSLIAGYLGHLSPGGSVLDLGCGEGILYRHLAPLGCSEYTGVDLSEEAVARAATREDEATTYVAADAESYRPAQRFDAVVFNECLYYFRDPAGVVDRYREYLTEDGFFVVSMFESLRTSAIARQLDGSFVQVLQARLSNRKGSWTVSVYRP
jgi:2-polyprenyl-3-methyl-5-hydroxy-6-metoxy-1,4-benzoquinol methylase